MYKRYKINLKKKGLSEQNFDEEIIMCQFKNRWQALFLSGPKYI